MYNPITRTSRRSGLTWYTALALFIALAMLSASLTVAVSAALAQVQNPGGNVTCEELGFEHTSGRINYNDGNGSFAAPFPSGISVTVTDHKFVSWSSTFLIGAVIVKGGPDANVYDYRPNGSLGASGLVSPLNPGGNIPNLSNLTFCWDAPQP
jgi:hypothetical protein